MASRYSLEMVDRTLRQIRRCEEVMGGVLFLLGGDFRQTLPIVPRGTRADILAECLKASPLWPGVEVRHLRQNMRLAPHEAEFADVLLQIGEGRYPNRDGLIKIPAELRSPHESWKDFVDSIPVADNNAVLTPLNSRVDEVNHYQLERFPGDVRTFLSFTSAPDANNTLYPLEVLQSVRLSGMPPHQLLLKRNCPVIILRNIESPVLCNGTRCRVVEMGPNLLEVEVVGGPHAGVRRFLSRIIFNPLESEFPVSFRRVQFPVKLGFCLTLNRSQGQTLNEVGVLLSPSVFAHGMLYVAFSRSTSSANLKVWSRTEETQNVVYPEVL